MFLEKLQADTAEERQLVKGIIRYGGLQGLPPAPLLIRDPGSSWQFL